MIERRTFSGRAYTYSIVFHALLLVVFIKLEIMPKVTQPKFMEFSVSTISQERLGQILEESRRAEEWRRFSEKGLSPQERVEIPERKMIDIDIPEISVPSEKRIESGDIVSGAERQSIEIERTDVGFRPGPVLPMERKESFPGSRITVGETPGSGMETVTIGADLAFTVEGEIQEREMINNPLPSYPEGLNRSALIRIRIVVLPDGSISSSEMVPVRKENQVLEELSMRYLRLWRFAPLPAGDDRRQTGIVSFNFRIN